VTADKNDDPTVKAINSLTLSVVAIFIACLLAFGVAPVAVADSQSTEAAEAEDSAAGQEITVSLDANGGDLLVTQKTVVVGTAFGTLPLPSRVGCNFVGWYTKKVGGRRVTSTMIVDQRLRRTLYAHWSGKSYSVQLKPRNGESPSSIEVKYGSSYGPLPTPIRPGYVLVGWFTEANGGSRVSASETVLVDADQTLYAQWTPGKFRVKFRPGKGTVAKEAKTVKYKAKYGRLPIPERDDYEFRGWFTKPSGGTRIVSSSKVEITEDTKLYAHWHKLPTKADGWVDVDLTKMTAKLMRGDKVIKVFKISPGKPRSPTPQGSFRIYKKRPIVDMNHTDVKWVSWFVNRVAFHEAYWHNEFGIAAVSHGCINMRGVDAKRLYDFVRIGTIVEVHR